MNFGTSSWTCATDHHRTTERLFSCHITFRHAHLVIPQLKNVLPVLVLQLNIACQILCSLSHFRLFCASPTPGLGIPSGLGRMVSGVIALLLIMSGDIETNPGPIGEFLVYVAWSLRYWLCSWADKDGNHQWGKPCIQAIFSDWLAAL